MVTYVHNETKGKNARESQYQQTLDTSEMSMNKEMATLLASHWLLNSYEWTKFIYINREKSSKTLRLKKQKKWHMI